MERRQHIPEDLVINILLRLPVKSLFRFKAVCKSWNLLITSSSFIHAWDAIAISRDAAAGGKLLCFYQRNDDESQAPVLSLFDPDSGEPKITFLDWPLLYYNNNWYKQDGNRQELAVSVIGPVHGVYCIYKKHCGSVNMVTLWNPATGHFKNIIIPSVLPLPSESPTTIWCYGLRFGFDSTTNDFKLVLIYRWFDLLAGMHHIFKVYDMSTNSWKTTHHLDNNDPSCNPRLIKLFDRGVEIGDGCFVNGACHWLCHWMDVNRHWHRGALAFDLATESFQLINGPPRMFDCHNQEIIRRRQDNLSLAMTTFHDLPSRYHEVWVMTQYGVEDSWVKLYSIELEGPIRSLGIPNDVSLLFPIGRKFVGSSILKRAFKVQGLRPPTSSDLERKMRNTRLLRYEETLVGASIFNRHCCSSEIRKGKFAPCKRLCTRAPSNMPSVKK